MTAAFQGRELDGFGWIKIAASFALIMSACVVVLPVRAGLRRLEEMETLRDTVTIELRRA